jgi:hypothetical protein
MFIRPKLMARARNVSFFMRRSPFPPPFLDAGNVSAQDGGTRDFACHDCNGNVQNVFVIRYCDASEDFVKALRLCCPAFGTSAFNATGDTKQGTADAPTQLSWGETQRHSPPHVHSEPTMKIGIIGAGHIGGTLTRRLRSLGHEVRVANSRGPESLQDLSKETGAEAVEAPDAPKGADLVIVTIPEKNIPNLPKDLFANPNFRPRRSVSY